MNIIFTVFGLVLLCIGGDLVVRGAMRLSRRLNLSPFFVGMIVVGFGTSLPELVVCIDAALNDSPALAVGNVIGSNIANTLLILGLAATICPVVVNAREVFKDNAALVSLTSLFSAFGFLLGQIDWIQGAVLIAALTGYVAFGAFQRQESGHTSKNHSTPDSGGMVKIALIFGGGFAAILVGAELLVDGAVGISQRLGVSKEVIGLTIIAIGTSLPEIATVCAAAWRGNTQLCLGNVIGSNLFNISGMAGITSLIAPLPFAGQIVDFDLYVLVATTGLISIILVAGQRISRPTGYFLTAAYGVYLATQVYFVF